MLRILFVIPYVEVEQQVELAFREIETLKEEKISYEIRQAEISGEVEVEEGAADIVIVRGFAAERIRTSIPKIELLVSPLSREKNCFCRHFKYDLRSGFPGRTYG